MMITFNRGAPGICVEVDTTRSVVTTRFDKKCTRIKDAEISDKPPCSPWETKFSSCLFAALWGADQAFWRALFLIGVQYLVMACERKVSISVSQK